MEFYFVPPGKRALDRDDEGSGLGTLPQALLDRHGARVLHPSSAPVADGWPAPRSTVYRARTLLVPPTLLREQPLRQLNDVLERVGMRLVPVTVPREAPDHPQADDDPQADDSAEADDDPERDDEPEPDDDPELADLPTVAVLIGPDANRAVTRVVAAVASLQLVCKTAKVAAGAKAARVGLITPKAKDSSA